jgi:hypothetical protein
MNHIISLYLLVNNEKYILTLLLIGLMGTSIDPPVFDTTPIGMTKKSTSQQARSEYLNGYSWIK